MSSDISLLLIKISDLKSDIQTNGFLIKYLEDRIRNLKNNKTIENASYPSRASQIISTEQSIAKFIAIAELRVAELRIAELRIAELRVAE